MVKNIACLMLILTMSSAACRLPINPSSEVPVSGVKETISAAKSLIPGGGKVQDALATLAAIQTELPEGADAFLTLNAPQPTLAPFPTPAYTPSAPDLHAVGEQVNIGSLTWIVLNWYLRQDPFMPTKTLVVNALVINRSEGTLYVPNSFTHKDVKGQDTFSEFAVNMAPGERTLITLEFFTENMPAYLALEADTDFGRPSKRIIWDLGPNSAGVEAPPLLPGEKSQPVHQIGDIVQLASLEIQATKVDYPPKDHLSYEGYHYIAIDLIFNNKGSKDIDIDQNIFVSIKDGEGNYYSDWFAMNGGTLFPDGRLETTAKIQVPEDASGLKLEVDGYLLGWEKVFIQLTP